MLDRKATLQRTAKRASIKALLQILLFKGLSPVGREIAHKELMLKSRRS